MEFVTNLVTTDDKGRKTLLALILAATLFEYSLSMF